MILFVSHQYFLLICIYMLSLFSVPDEIPLVCRTYIKCVKLNKMKKKNKYVIISPQLNFFKVGYRWHLPVWHCIQISIWFITGTEEYALILSKHATRRLLKSHELRDHVQWEPMHHHLKHVRTEVHSTCYIQGPLCFKNYFIKMDFKTYTYIYITPSPRKKQIHNGLGCVHFILDSLEFLFVWEWNTKFDYKNKRKCVAIFMLFQFLYIVRAEVISNVVTKEKRGKGL